MRLQSDRRRLALDGLALAVATPPLVYVLGSPGLGVAVVVAVTLVFVSPVYAFVVGQQLFVVVATTVYGDVPVEGLVMTQVGLEALLAVALLDRWPRRTAAVAVAVLARTAPSRSSRVRVDRFGSVGPRDRGVAAPLSLLGRPPTPAVVHV